jgi:hypothetical protein
MVMITMTVRSRFRHQPEKIIAAGPQPPWPARNGTPLKGRWGSMVMITMTVRSMTSTS